MKRKDIVTKLVKEGLSEKTLANMSDKQLNILAKRFLSEQSYNPVLSTTSTTPGTNSPSVLNIPKTDQAAIADAKNKKLKFATYEGQAQVGEELSEPKLGTKPKTTDEKEVIIKRLKFKIEHEKDKDKVEDAKKLLAKMTEKKKEVAEGEFKSKTEWLKSKGIIKDDDKKETTESSDVAEPEPEKKKGEKEKKETKGEGGAEYEKRLAKGNLGFGLNEWVSGVVEKNYHPFTSKSEIMEMIKAKINEQTSDVEVETLPDFLTGDAIMSAVGTQTAEPTTKPTTKPGTKPTTRPTPKTPYQPGPGPKHNPKAGRKI